MMFLFALLLATHVTHQEEMEALNQLQYQFEYHYAPKELKEETLGWNLTREIKKLKELRKNSDDQIWRRFLKGFFDSTQDTHVQAYFLSTGSSTLPFHLAEAEGRYFVVHVYDKECPLKTGDELLAWNGEAINEIAQKFMEKEFARMAPNRTTFELATYYLTRRDGKMGLQPEKGEVEIDFIRGEDLRHATLSWETNSEHYPGTLPPKRVVSSRKRFQDFLSVISMLSPAFTKLEEEREKEGEKENPFALGKRNSFIPPLGPLLWQSWKKDPYFSYLFETPQGAKIGFLRIPHFRSDKPADFYSLVRIVRKLKEKGADLLIIDLLHNPGGDIFNLYAIASLFIDQPIKAFLEKNIVSDRAEIALVFKHTLTNPIALEVYRKEKKSLDCGYPNDERLEKNLLAYSDHILEQIAKGVKISSPYPIFGISEILPHPNLQFGGPILMLIDSLDFSCGDLFPALLKDAERVTLFGTKTAGAGGTVEKVKCPSMLGISGLSLTTSLCIRPNGEIVEGIGIKPDVEYHLTPQDYLNNFEPMREKILDTIHKMLSVKKEF